MLNKSLSKNLAVMIVCEETHRAEPSIESIISAEPSTQRGVCRVHGCHFRSEANELNVAHFIEAHGFPRCPRCTKEFVHLINNKFVTLSDALVMTGPELKAHMAAQPTHKQTWNAPLASHHFNALTSSIYMKLFAAQVSVVPVNKWL